MQHRARDELISMRDEDCRHNNFSLWDEQSRIAFYCCAIRTSKSLAQKADRSSHDPKQINTSKEGLNT